MQAHPQHLKATNPVGKALTYPRATNLPMYAWRKGWALLGKVLAGIGGDNRWIQLNVIFEFYLDQIPSKEANYDSRKADSA